MATKIPDKKIELIKRMYKQREQGGKKLSIYDIAKRAGVSYVTAYAYSRYNSSMDYFNKFAKGAGCKSFHEYQEKIARKRGYDSASKYFVDSIKKRGFKTIAEYQEWCLKKQGFNSKGEYLESLAKKKGFKTLGDYNKLVEKARQEKKENKKFSSVLKKRMSELNISGVSLAKQLGVHPLAVSYYRTGRVLPRTEKQEKIFRILKLPYRSIDELVSNSQGRDNQK